MTKKKLTVMITSLALISVVGIGATLAYFTDNAEVSNTVGLGHVDIVLTETDSDGNITSDGLVFEDVLPGQIVDKDPTVSIVEGSADSFIRMKMEMVTGDDSTITKKDLDLLENNLRDEILKDSDWYYNEAEDFYYFNQTLSAGESATLFEKVTIPGEWLNNTAGQSFAIQLQGEAVQAAYFTPVRNEEGTQIISWGNVQIEKYK